MEDGFGYLRARTLSFTSPTFHVTSQLPSPPHEFLFLNPCLFCDKALVEHK